MMSAGQDYPEGAYSTFWSRFTLKGEASGPMGLLRSRARAYAGPCKPDLHTKLPLPAADVRVPVMDAVDEATAEAIASEEWQEPDSRRAPQQPGEPQLAEIIALAISAAMRAKETAPPGSRELPPAANPAAAGKKPQLLSPLPWTPL